MKQQKQLELKRFQSEEGFIYQYQKLIKDVVIPYQYDVINDKIGDAPKSHVVANFLNAAKAISGENEGDGFFGMVFQDSDAAKWIEAAAYSITVFPDDQLEKQVDDLIDIIEKAQDKDGYLNTYFTVKDKDKRWKNLFEGHELYCAGHMIEAAVAYFETTGKDKLLNVMLRNVEHIYNHFIVNQQAGYPGHPEVELALLKMYKATKNEKCLKLAKHFIDMRGVDPHFYENEAKCRDWTIWGCDPLDHEYMQSSKPVRQQTDATGHSVRAVYLYTGMADLAAETNDDELKEACRRLWDSIVNRRMYITGGIGSTAIGEAFTVDYNLPNDTAYAETCASIGLMFFASKMLEIEVDSQYTNVMERAFYNTVLAGMQLDGKRFFYVNPLEVIPGISGEAVTHKHDLPERPGWYICACCPPNVARTIASFGKYAYGENESTAFCHMYAAGSICFENGMKIQCETMYPYDFTVTYKVIQGGKRLALRCPDWSNNFKVTINGIETKYEMIKGYAYLPELNSGDKVIVYMDDSVKQIYSSVKVADNSNCVAIQRGPLVYCFEGIDNSADVLSLSLSGDSIFKVDKYNKNLMNGTVKLEVQGYRTRDCQNLYTMTKPVKDECTMIAVPYYTWGNRGKTQMRVWIPEN